jgi:glycosyltransferase involved in cell wall biosynthesis
MKKMISVITITYNNAAGLQKTINSLRMQHCDLSEIELLVVNGNPDDKETMKIISANSDLITWSQSEPDGGIYPAMNIGKARAKGEWQWYMNAGDIFADDDVVGDVLEAINHYPKVDYIYGDVYRCDYQQTWAGMPINPHYKKIPTCHQSMLFKSKLMENRWYSEKYKICSDRVLIEDYLLDSENPLYLPRTLSHFEGGGLSGQKQLLSAWEGLLIQHRSGKVSFRDNMKKYGGRLVHFALQEYCPKLLLFTESIHKILKSPQDTKEILVMATPPTVPAAKPVN